MYSTYCTSHAACRNASGKAIWVLGHVAAATRHPGPLALGRPSRTTMTEDSGRDGRCADTIFLWAIIRTVRVAMI